MYVRSIILNQPTPYKSAPSDSDRVSPSSATTRRLLLPYMSSFPLSKLDNRTATKKSRRINATLIDNVTKCPPERHYSYLTVTVFPRTKHIAPSPSPSSSPPRAQPPVPNHGDKTFEAFRIALVCAAACFRSKVSKSVTLPASLPPHPPTHARGCFVATTRRHVPCAVVSTPPFTSRPSQHKRTHPTSTPHHRPAAFGRSPKSTSTFSTLQEHSVPALLTPTPPTMHAFSLAASMGSHNLVSQTPTPKEGRRAQHPMIKI